MKVCEERLSSEPAQNMGGVFGGEGGGCLFAFGPFVSVFQSWIGNLGAFMLLVLKCRSIIIVTALVKSNLFPTQSPKGTSLKY